MAHKALARLGWRVVWPPALSFPFAAPGDNDMSFTYAELKQAIKDYTENDETTFTNNIPVFIRNAEERILKNVQLSEFRKNVTGSSTTSNKLSKHGCKWISDVVIYPSVKVAGENVFYADIGKVGANAAISMKRRIL